MLGLQINDIIRALIAAGVELTDDILIEAQVLKEAAHSISTECMEEERFLQGRIEFVYVRYDAETDTVLPVDPQPTPVETPRKFNVGDKALVLSKERSDYGQVITVEGYTAENYVFHNGNGYCSYHESELEPAE